VLTERCLDIARGHFAKNDIHRVPKLATPLGSSTPHLVCSP